MGGARGRPAGWRGTRRDGILRLASVLLLALVIAVGVGAAFAWSEIHARSVTLADRRAFADALEQRLADVPELRQDIDRMRKAESFVAREVAAQPSAMVVVEIASRVLPIRYGSPV